eukprot:TRINITY_DN27483_c0_g1_i1.p1 TRINITY_DN27483_c0_g1~~TRINITY_DN27483_c0_g1_i1.p1  ORF type:complete len:517 (-),score=115.63 TRINITY_DN27483_c0_g1_i1:11-1561(-)
MEEGRALPNEETLVFDLKPVPASAIKAAVCENRLTDDTSKGQPHIPMGAVANPGRMSDAGYCAKEDVETLWKQKTRLDDIFDAGMSQLYWRAREELYPVAGHRGSALQDLGNRAGDKLEEISKAVGGLRVKRLEQKEEVVFADVCGAPGAWSKYLFQLGEKNGCKTVGYGFSLRDGTNPLSCTWYKDLPSRFNFTPLWGADGTGNVCDSDNVTAAAAEAGRQADIVVADGGTGVGAGTKGEHMENYQEILFGGLLLAEVRFMLETAREGACFVCKFFDTFTHLTCGLLFAVAALFEDAKIVKPRHSRLVNSERYLVGLVFKGPQADGFDALLGAIREAQAAWPRQGQGIEPWAGDAPLGFIDLAALEDAPEFLKSVREMSQSLCRRQAQGLEAVVNRALELKSQGASTEPPPKRRRRRPPAAGAVGGSASAVNGAGGAAADAVDATDGAVGACPSTAGGDDNKGSMTCTAGSAAISAATSSCTALGGDNRGSPVGADGSTASSLIGGQRTAEGTRG